MKKEVTLTMAKRYRSGILATCCVPWTEDFSFAEDLFRRQVRHVISQGIRDLYIFGTAGEGYAVSETQFDEITHAFIGETQGDNVRGMVGVISLSLPTIIGRIERAHAMGARRFQLSLPSWGSLNDAEVATFFRETCARFPDVEFLHYNLMRAGRILTGAEYGRLAAEHRNLVATKNSTADIARLQSLMSEAPQLQHFITEGGFPIAALMGECGLLISFTSTNFARAVEFYRAGHDQDADQLASLSADFPGLIEAIKDASGDAAHMDGAFDKLFCRIHTPSFPLRLLPPYAFVSEESFERYAKHLRSHYPQWLPT